MKPDVKKILTKLSENKVELSEAKAKALIKDLQKLENELKNIEKLKTVANKEISEAGDFMEIYGRGKDRYNTLYDGFEKKARELGIKVDQIPVIKELNKAFDDAADAYVPISQKISKVGDLSGYFS